MTSEKIKNEREKRRSGIELTFISVVLGILTVQTMSGIWTQEGVNPVSDALLKGLSNKIADRCLTDPNNSLSDIKIKVKDETFHCHRVILAAYSDFFMSMFTLDFREKHQDEINLQIPVDAETFRLTLDFLYGRREQLISYEDALQILKVADSLQIDCLKLKAENYLIAKVSLDNCVDMLKVGSTWHCQRLINQSLIRIVTYFERKKLYELSEFQTLEESEVILILQDNDLFVSSEDVVADAIFAWLRHDENRWKTSTAAKVLKHLRFPLISTDYLTTLIEQNPFLTADPECFVYVTEALRYNLQPARRHEIDSERVLHRNSSDFENVIYVFRRGNLHLICFQKKMARNLGSFTEGRFYAACSYGTSIFLSGGVKTENKLLEYNILLNKWINHPNIPTNYLDHTMVAVGSEFFLLGIRQDIWKFNVQAQTWKRAGKLCKAVQRTSSAVQGQSILVFGGFKSLERDKDFHQKVQRFDTVTGSCDELPHTVEKPLKCTVSNGTVYVVDTEGKIMTFSVVDGFRDVGAFCDFSFKLFGICVFGSILYAVTPWRENGEDFDMIRRWSLKDNKELRRMKTKALGYLEGVVINVAKKSDQLLPVTSLISV